MERTWACPHCPELTFTSEAEQSSHRRYTHQKSITLTFASDNATVVVERDAETGFFQCPRCPLRYSHPASLGGHALVCAEDNGSVVDTTLAGSSTSNSVSFDNGLACVHCPERSFEDEDALSSHHTYIHVRSSEAYITFGLDGTKAVVQRDPLSELFVCPRCPIASKSQRGLSNHARLCTAAAPEPVPDEQPNASSSNSAQAAAAPKLSYCPHCPELVFRNDSHLGYHVSVHHQEKAVITFGNDGGKGESYRDAETGKFGCTRCSYQTTSSNSLYAHARVFCKVLQAQEPDVDGAAQGQTGSSSTPNGSSVSPASPDGQGSGSSNNVAASATAPANARSFPCSRCPGLTFETHTKLWYHHQTQHQQQVTVKFSNGDVVVLDRDPVSKSKAFHCTRCPRRSKPPITAQRHAMKCPGAALQLADGTIDNKLDLDALKELDLFYDTTYCALVCVPCEAAVTLDRLPDHWSKASHKGEPHDLADVRRAMGAHIHIWPALLARPDPYGSVIPFLEWIMGYRCTVCDWCGKRHPETHWNSNMRRPSGHNFFRHWVINL